MSGEFNFSTSTNLTLLVGGGRGPLYFSDPQSTTNVQRFYRVQLLQ
jgi:hypothetical protein